MDGWEVEDNWMKGSPALAMLNAAFARKDVKPLTPNLWQASWVSSNHRLTACYSTLQRMLKVLDDHPSVLAVQQGRSGLHPEITVSGVLLEVVVPVGDRGEEDVEDDVDGGRKVLFGGTLLTAGKRLGIRDEIVRRVVGGTNGGACGCPSISIPARSHVSPRHGLTKM